MTHLYIPMRMSADIRRILGRFAARIASLSGLGNENRVSREPKGIEADG